MSIGTPLIFKNVIKDPAAAQTVFDLEFLPGRKPV